MCCFFLDYGYAGYHNIHGPYVAVNNSTNNNVFFVCFRFENNTL